MLKKPINKGDLSNPLYQVVELRGIEPLSKNSPTFRRLQFILLLNKTISMTASERLIEFACQLSGSPYRLQDHLIRLNYTADAKRRMHLPGAAARYSAIKQRMRNYCFC